MDDTDVVAAAAAALEAGRLDEAEPAGREDSVTGDAILAGPALGTGPGSNLSPLGRNHSVRSSLVRRTLQPCSCTSLW